MAISIPMVPEASNKGNGEEKKSVRVRDLCWSIKPKPARTPKCHLSSMQLPLPRLLHFLDLVLPQMVPVFSPAQVVGSHSPVANSFRDLWLERSAFIQGPDIKLMRMFPFHTGSICKNSVIHSLISKLERGLSW